jgi:SMC interacting uncharacterized protein involved in chromosome segregation
MPDDRPDADAAAILRDLIGQWESAVNARLNEAMATDEFSRNVNEAIAASLGAQRSMGDLLERYLRLLNLPSRADVASFDARLRSVEEKLDLVLRLLSRLPAVSDAPNAMPPRTKQPPAEP